MSKPAPTTLPVPSIPQFAIKQLPWLTSPFINLYQGLMGKRPPHAILISGIQGIGKEILVDHIVARLLCLDQTQTYACGICKSCIWLKNSTHPDFMMVKPELADKPIKIDQIRVLNDFFQLTARNKYKIALIRDAHLMNTNAANSLLKTLEEPPGNGLIFLITAHPQKLPITVRSRMQQLTIPCPQHSLALDFLSSLENSPAKNTQDTYSEILHLTHNAPLLALKWYTTGIFETRTKLMNAFILSLKNPEKRAESADILAKESHLSIDLLCSWLNDALRLKVNINASIHHATYRTQLIDLHQTHSLLTLCTQYSELLLINQRLDTQMRIDWQLESWLMGF